MILLEIVWSLLTCTFSRFDWTRTEEDRTRPQMIPILTKWSSKITAASLQLGSKQAGGSKFLQGTKDGSGGIIEAIEASIAAKVSDIFCSVGGGLMA